MNSALSFNYLRQTQLHITHQVCVYYISLNTKASNFRKLSEVILNFHINLYQRSLFKRAPPIKGIIQSCLKK